MFKIRIIHGYQIVNWLPKGNLLGLAKWRAHICSVKFKRFIMKVQLLRNATQILTVNGKTLLIDPMLAPKGTYEPFRNTANTLKNPLVDLPIDDAELRQLIAKTDAVLLTHLHPDHWDTAAQRLIPKTMTIICQPADTETLEQTGFVNLIPVADNLLWHNIQIIRTGGQHGTGDIGKLMGTVSGYMISYQQNRLYIAGDTIWCDDVQEAIDNYNPDMIIVNGGGARFKTGAPIVMSINDVIKIYRHAIDARIYVVHLEAVNHATESRALIKSALKIGGLSDRCFVPNDGELFI
jgi:L-ascorbate metabolism protein UlaG (beta-lactamase superfamily)